jgi:hypothetical protein
MAMPVARLATRTVAVERLQFDAGNTGASRAGQASLENASYLKLPQKRWMRLQASSRSEVLVA